MNDQDTNKESLDSSNNNSDKFYGIAHQPFRKIERFTDYKVTATEKIDGTNAVIYVDVERNIVLAGSRNRWLTEDFDNYDFWRYVNENREILKTVLGNGTHYGEWVGDKISATRNYGMEEGCRELVLFNHQKWEHPSQLEKLKQVPNCSVIPVIYHGKYTDNVREDIFKKLKNEGSQFKKGYMNPEGVIYYFHSSRTYFKDTYDAPKWQQANAKLKE